ncbi:MAG: glycoside hydrolase family 2 TIM barrel-domain containing protein [Bacteroidota bacterium]
MKNIIHFFFCLVILSACQAPQSIEKDRQQDFNFGWKFSLDAPDEAFQTKFSDEDWRVLDLPHDWSVEFPFDSTKEGATGYLPGGIGWYRKHFKTEQNENQKTYLIFDGIYNHSEIWLNGTKLGGRPYGYVPFYFDLTPHLKAKGEENVLAVKVDRSRYVDSRWYSGSGIYRNVELAIVDKLHIPVWGTFATTPEVTEKSALVNLQVELQNDYAVEKSVMLKTSILAPDGETIQTSESQHTIAANTKESLQQELTVESPQLWDIAAPNLYQAITTVFENGKDLGQYTTTFGIRTFEFDPAKGFFLNGKNHKIKGVCLHHDGGLVGAAVPKGVWRRRLQTLRDGGCNAVRISHNPGSQEFLDLCDEMGFLVQDEFFDEWDYPKDKRLNKYETHDDYISRGSADYFQEWAEADLKNSVLAHRNHPSIIQWSIGNEIEWTYSRTQEATGFFDNADWSGNYFWSTSPYTPAKIREVYESLPEKEYTIEYTGRKLAAWTRELDTTRAITANCILPSATLETGLADALDVVGFSYRRVVYDYAQKHYPNQAVMGTENLGQWHEWKAVMERPFISGTFLWTGIDYMGESNGAWPRKAVASGLLDLGGFPKPSYQMMKTLWTEAPHLAITTQTLAKSIYKLNDIGEVIEKKEGRWERALWVWHDVNRHWNYEADEMVITEILSNCEEVELFLNGESLGKKRLVDFPDHIYKWALPFAAGELLAKGYKNGEIVETKVVTAGEPTQVSVDLDHNKLNANNYDVAHLVVQLLDGEGHPVLHTNRKLTFEVEGALKSLGVDTGAADNVQTYQANSLVTSEGRALLIVQATKKKGRGVVRVSGEDLGSEEITIEVGL